MDRHPSSTRLGTCSADTDEQLVETLVFDEAGATGVDLLNADQPVFTLASFFSSDEAAAEMLAHLPHPVAGELHFAKARKNADGRANLVALINELLHGTGVKRTRVSVVHKRFMLVAKMVDELVETPMRDRGFDIYQSNWHVDASNVLFHHGEHSVGPGLWNQLLATFRAAAVTQDRTVGADLLDVLAAARQACTRATVAVILEEMPRSLEELDAAGLQVGDSDTHRSSLDPAVTTLMEQLNAWSLERGTDAVRFPVVHDQGAIGPQRWQEIYRLAMRAAPGRVVMPSEKGEMVFPLNASSLTFADSASKPQLQLADVMASAVNFVLTGRLVGRVSDPRFCETLDDLGVRELVTLGLWPITQ